MNGKKWSAVLAVSVVSTTVVLLLAGLVANATGPTSNEKAGELLKSAVSILQNIGDLGAFEGVEGTSSGAENRPPQTPQERKRLLDEAIKELKKAVRIDPSLTDARHFLGVAYTLANRRNDAIDILESAVNGESLRQMTYVVLCGLLWEKHEFKKALDVANAFSGRFPDERELADEMLATAHYHMGDYQKAIEFARKALAIDDRRIAAHLIIGHSYFVQGDRRGAEEEYNKVLRIDPQMKNQIEQMKRELDCRKGPRNQEPY
jgi:tetratricopeptide (TPR) repeat protein